jgi:plasmid maintenance system antidote protein VapI
MSIEQLLRQSILTCGQSVHAVARAVGVSQPCLHYFVHGESTLTLRTAQKLMDYFRFEVRPKAG